MGLGFFCVMSQEGFELRVTWPVLVLAGSPWLLHGEWAEGEQERIIRRLLQVQVRGDGDLDQDVMVKICQTKDKF